MHHLLSDAWEKKVLLCILCILFSFPTVHNGRLSPGLVITPWKSPQHTFVILRAISERFLEIHPVESPIRMSGPGALQRVFYV